MKKHKSNKKPKNYKPSKPDDLVEELNAVSATDFTGLIPANPDFYSEENYEEIMHRVPPQPDRAKDRY